jgi:diadenosine tetraphosphate (Ap4A) HIT family hydrolase
MQEINRLSLLVNQYYQPKKLNIASLGNIVEQLHIHCVARTEHDPLWPQGIWQAAYVSEPYAEERIKTIVSEHQRLVSKL